VASGRSQLLTSTASTNRQIQHAHPGRRSSNRQACATGSWSADTMCTPPDQAAS